MKKLLPLFCALGFIAQPALAANNITALQNLDQNGFNAISEDLGSALSYKPVSPPTPLGITGFDIGIEMTSTNLAKSSQYWSQITGGSNISSLVVPKLHVAKGLPFGLDIAAFYSKIPTTNISLIGGELRYALIDNIALPTVSIRGAFTKLSGVDQLSFGTKSLDVSISQAFVMLTPYAGVGKVWVNSSANVTSTVAGTSFGIALSDKFSQNKIFAGLNLNLGLMNLAAEVDKTGAARSISAKVGFRW
jgi:hypothetical protein